MTTECHYCENMTQSKPGNYRGFTACGPCKNELRDEDRREEATPSTTCIYCTKKGKESPMNLQDWNGWEGWWECNSHDCDGEYQSKGRKKWSSKTQDPKPTKTKKVKKVQCYACDSVAVGKADRTFNSEQAIVPACSRHSHAVLTF